MRPCTLRLPLLGLVAATLTAVVPAQAQFTPNETVVSRHRGLVDYEISQSRAKIAWTDPKGDLWLADINPVTGMFEPWHGRGQLIAQNTVANWNMFMWNGPEWFGTASGDAFNFSYYLPGRPKTAKFVRMAVATVDANGQWVTQPLQPLDVPRMMHITTRNPGDPNPMLKYLDPDLNHYIRDVKDPSTERVLSFLPPSNKSWRFASGLRALMYAAPVNGVQQVFQYRVDDDVSEQITTDDGNKDTERTVPWMFRAPEFDNTYVLTTVVDGSEVRVYRKLPDDAGVRRWTPVHSVTLPDRRIAGSPEWFTYNGKSYLFMVAYMPGKDYATEVWLTTIDPANPLLRKITPDEPYRVRNDPEVFITTSGPRIYYNRYDPSIDPDHPLCADCSEGVFMANPGSDGR